MNNLGGEVGIDSNILIHSINKDSLHYEKTRQLLKKLALKRVGVVCWQNLAEFYAIVTDPKRFANAIPPEKAAREVKKFIQDLKLVGQNLDTGKLWLEILMQNAIKGQKVHDIFLAATLISNGIEILLTENVKDFAGIKGLKVVDLGGILL